jgi:glutamyl/glutaminyl-tRNA synthetase
MSVVDLAKKCRPYLKELLEKTEEPSKKENKYIEKVVLVGQERLKKLEDIVDVSHFFFNDKLDYDENLLVWKKLSLKEAKENLGNLYEFLKDIDENNWEAKILEEKIITYIKEKEAKVGDYLWPMRVALTGEERSSGPFEVAWVLGKKASLERIKEAIK